MQPASPLTTGPRPGVGNRAIRFEIHAGGHLETVIGNDSADNDNGYSGHVFTSTGILANQWVHVALVWDSASNNVKGYLNGALAFNETNSTWPTNLPNLTLGGGWDSSRYFAGRLDEVGFFSRVLTGSEITSLASADFVTQTDGTTSLGSGGVLHGSIDIQGGSLLGTGTVRGDVENSNIVTPGNSPGIITIDGNYSQDNKNEINSADLD